MKKFLSIISFALMTIMAASAQDIVVRARGVEKTTYATDGSETLYIIDGVVATKTAADMLESDEIKNISVVKNIKQAMIINTKNGRTVSGHVIDTDGNPIFGVVVKVTDAPVGVVTGKSGYFELPLPAGKSLISFSVIDYPTRTIEAEKVNNCTVVMSKSEEAELNIIPFPGTEVIGNVTIHPAVPATSSDVPAPLYIIKDAQGNIFQGSLDSITPDQIKSINVYKDASSLEQFKKYGDTSNGVVYVELK